MKSWAHTYMAGSLLGTVLIVAALVAFVPLVSLNAPDEWPTPSLGLDGGGAGRGDAGVGAAVVAAAGRLDAGRLNSNPVGGSSASLGTAIGAVPASGREAHTGGSAGPEAAAPARGTVAVSPVSIEVVTSNPGSPASEGGAAVPLPNPTETGSAPVSSVTDGDAGEAGSVGDIGETPSTTPIDAGVGPEGPESQPPELPDSVPPPPPSGGSTEGGDGPGCAEEGSEGEAAQAGDVSAPAASGLDPEPGW